jgi:hypothetical protein
LKPTPLGEVTTAIMNEHFPDIVDYKFTAVMEDRLDTIASGKETLEQVLSDFYEPNRFISYISYKWFFWLQVFTTLSKYATMVKVLRKFGFFRLRM